VGGLQLRYLECLENDIRELNIKMWRQKANDKRNWASVEKCSRSLDGHRAKVLAASC
jgi:hypothetical protein